MKKHTKILSAFLALVMAFSVFALTGVESAASNFTGTTAAGDPILATGNTLELAAKFAVGEKIFGTVNSGETVCYYFMNDAVRAITFSLTTDAAADFTVHNIQGTSLIQDSAATTKTYAPVNFPVGGHYVIIKGTGAAGTKTNFSFSTSAPDVTALMDVGINHTTATLNSGDTLQLALSNLVIPNINYYWTVFDNASTPYDERKIVTVTQDGNVSVAFPAAGLGFTQNVTVKVHAVFYYNNQYVSKYCTVTAVPANIFLEPYVETLKIGPSSTKTITATTNVDKTITWSSSNNDVATVSNSGIITGFNAGTATITARITGTNISRSIAVTVDPSIVNVKAVAFTEHSASVRVNENTKLAWNFTTYNGSGAPSNSNVTFTSSNPAVATVDKSGKVTGVAPGSATITITAEDGGSVDTCLVTVNEAMPTWLTIIVAPLKLLYYLIKLILGKN